MLKIKVINSITCSQTRTERDISVQLLALGTVVGAHTWSPTASKLWAGNFLHCGKRVVVVVHNYLIFRLSS